MLLLTLISKRFRYFLSWIQYSANDMATLKQDEIVGQVQVYLPTDNSSEYVHYEPPTTLSNHGEEMNRLNTKTKDKKNKMTNVPSNSGTAIMMQVPGGLLSLDKQLEPGVSNRKQEVLPHLETNFANEKCYR